LAVKKIYLFDIVYRKRF